MTRSWQIYSRRFLKRDEPDPITEAWPGAFPVDGWRASWCWRLRAGTGRLGERALERGNRAMSMKERRTFRT